jgi:ketosteroid isomerase-like protein
VPQENVEVVLASIAAYNAEDVDAQIATYTPDAVLVTDATMASIGMPASLHGREALRSFIRGETADWRGRYQASEVRAVGTNRVLCRGDWGGVGAASGIEAYQSTSLLFTLRDGLISRVEFFRDHDTAIKAAGLEQ